MLPLVLGGLTRHEHIDEWVQSELVQVDSLGGHQFRFVFDKSVLAEGDLDFSKAIENALRPGLNLMASAETDVFRYFQDTMRLLADEAPDLAIAKAADVWQHVDFGETIHVHRRRGDKYVEAGVYLDVECSCEWEREHGLQLVFRDGLEVVKVGMYDGHLTNAHAFGDPRLVGVVYRPVGWTREK